MAYTKKDWVDGITPITATELNRIEQGVEDAHTNIDNLDLTPYVRKDGNSDIDGKITVNQLEGGSGANGGILFEDGKHQITTNDGEGDFNIRVGNTFGDGATEIGYCGHIVFDQTTGTWTIRTTSQSHAVGNTPSWQGGLVMNQDGTLSYNGNKVWTSSSDGSGSGLDADTLDGKDASGTLQTTEKSNLVGAINEVFQDADNGKTNIYNAIVGMGTTPSSQDFDDLSTAISNITTGKKWATGTFSMNFTSNNVYVYKTISGLDFAPTFYVLSRNEGTNNIYTMNFFYSNDSSFYSAFQFYSPAWGNYSSKFETYHVALNSDGFQFRQIMRNCTQAYTHTASLRWMAFE